MTISLSMRAAFVLSTALLSMAGAASAATLTPIAPPSGATDVSLLGINNAGWTTGSAIYADGSSLGFLRDPTGIYSTFDIAGADFVQGRAVSNTNSVVGYYNDADGIQFEFVRASDGTITTLSDPASGLPLRGIAQGANDNGFIVGDTRVGTAQRGYILNTATNSLTYIDPAAGYSGTRARGIANDGTVVGWQTNISTGLQEGFVLSGGAIAPLTYPGAFQTYLESINNAGLAVGQWNDADGFSHGFSYDLATHAFIDINAPNADSTQVFGVNDSGQIVISSDAGSFIYSPDGPSAPDGSAVFAPIAGTDLPEGTDQFNITVKAGETYFIDPAASPGFLYQAGDGPDFASVTTTSDAALWLFDGSDWNFASNLVNGQTFAFGAAVDQFQLRDVTTTDGHYVTGLSFAEAGLFNGYQIALGSAVPEPGTWAMMVGGFGLIGAAFRRRPRAKPGFA